jgi:hypothetical protein
MKTLNELANNVFAKHNKITELTPIIDLARELGCIGDIIGRNYEVHNPQGELLFVIRQKSISVKQLNTLLKELDILKKIEYEASKKSNLRNKRK